MAQTHDTVPTGELASTSLNLIVVAVAFDVTDSALIGQFVAHAFVGVDSPVRVNFVVRVISYYGGSVDSFRYSPWPATV